MAKKEKGGIGFLGALGLIFITLKLCNVINWSWWWVTSPLWGGLALIGIAWLIIFLIIFFVSLFIKIND